MQVEHLERRETKKAPNTSAKRELQPVPGAEEFSPCSRAGAHQDVALGIFGTMIIHNARHARGLAGEENSCSSVRKRTVGTERHAGEGM